MKSGSVINSTRIGGVTFSVDMATESQVAQSAIYSVIFSPDDTRIASVSLDGTIRIWDAVSGAEMLAAFEGHNTCGFSAEFSSDGSHIVALTFMGELIGAWDATSGQPLHHPAFTRIDIPVDVSVEILSSLLITNG